MSTQVKKKHAPKGVRLGWKPLKEVKPVKLTPEMIKGAKVNPNRLDSKNRSNPIKPFLIP